MGDGGGVGVDQEQDGCSAVAISDAEVVHPAGAAEADFAAVVDVVEADPEVLVGWLTCR